MTYSHAERLSALDTSFLTLEDQNAHMHIGAVALFDAAPLAGPSGGVDIDRVRRLMEAGLHRIPRYRQRVNFVPFSIAHPTWEDDPDFDIRNHVFHVHMPS